LETPKEVTTQQLAELKRAYATGALRVRFGETDITYKSEAEMRRTIDRLERELGVLTKPTLVTPRFSKGLGR
jgi:phage-related minor tail protein